MSQCPKEQTYPEVNGEIYVIVPWDEIMENVRTKQGPIADDICDVKPLK